MTISKFTNHFQTAPTHTPSPQAGDTPSKEVKNMALRKKKDLAEADRRAWDSLSETDKAVLLDSARNGYRSNVDQSPWYETSFIIRRFH
ncbi:MAG: hypothetical protein JJE02_10555 [Propionibacteriales bacterium]|nr:hypothetical protein [Propionibacteriales bacterium]